MRKYLFSLYCVMAYQGLVFAEESHILEESIVNAPLMQTKLDELSRNVYSIDKNALNNKGFKDSESVFRYTPFVSLSNLGLGANLDLRGQGNKANTSVQVLINGVYANMLDSSHGVTPLNTLAPSSIEEIEILPGGGAVRYGNGTRGGVVNIITRKKFEQPFLSIGGTFLRNTASFGNNYNADIKYGDKIDNSHLNIGAAFLAKRGPRSFDKTSGGQFNFGILQELDLSSNFIFDIDFFKGNIHTTPNNSFIDNANPSKADRKKPGNGRLNNEQTRFTTNLAYEKEINENFKYDAKLFYHYNKINYLDSITRLSSYTQSGITFSPTYANQSGSFFDDQKIGFNANLDFKHQDGRFLAGFESLYQSSKRTMVQNIQGTGTNTLDMIGTGGFPAMGGNNNSFSAATNQAILYSHSLNIPFEGNKFSNALYAIEKYDFNEQFTLTGGGV